MTSVRFPPYAALSADLGGVLDCSAVEGVDGSGAPCYDALTDTQEVALPYHLA